MGVKFGVGISASKCKWFTNSEKNPNVAKEKKLE